MTHHTIWKYTLEPTTHQLLYLPAGAKPLAAQLQGDELCVWVEVDPTLPATTPYLIGVYGTGYAFEPGGNYLGTVQPPGPVPLVFHVFWQVTA
jgi:hypothetical protein